MKHKIKDVLFNISGLLKDIGVVNHFSEARAILAMILEREVNSVHPAMDIEIDDSDYQRLMLLVQRRISGEPLQLITGYVGFYNCLLKCESGVFIPRIETEIIVDAALKHLSEFPPDTHARVLDLACGCGAISVALAMSEPRHLFFGIDSSGKAIDLAKRNSEMNGVADRISFMQGDYFEPVKGWKDVRFNVITANPPYVRMDNILNLGKDVKDWDPMDALDGGIDGLDHYKIIGSRIFNYLASDGVAIFEIDPEYVNPLKRIFDDYNLVISNIYNDFDGNHRAIEVRCG